jgi:hypothetical protein
VKTHMLVPVAVLTSVLLLAGCGGTSTQSDPAAPATQATTQAPAAEPAPTPVETEPAVTPGPVGSRSNPVPVGATATVEEYTVSVDASNVDAWPALQAAGTSNSAPNAGMSYVMVAVHVVNSSGTMQSPGQLDLGFAGNTVESYGQGWSSDRGGCKPEPFESDLNMAPILDPGDAHTGFACIAIPTAEVAGGTWHIWSNVHNDGDSIYFATQ